MSQGIRGEIVTCSTPTYDGITRAPRAPRVLARITEAPSGLFLARCEHCSFTDDCASLSHAAHRAETHTIKSGHPVLVEAL